MNYEKKFTPGPWVIAEDKDIVTKQDIEGDVICLQPGFVVLNESKKYWEHNAHLISSAPELLDALIDVLEWAEDNGMSSFLYDRCKSSVNKALNIKDDEL